MERPFDDPVPPSGEPPQPSPESPTRHLELVPPIAEHVPVPPSTVTAAEAEVREHLFTPANLMTAARPFLAGVAAWRLATGRPRSGRYAVGAAVTDLEGFPARGIDWLSIFLTGKRNGWGTTAHGKLGDPIADTIALGEVAAGALASPKVSRLGKIAVGIVGISEAVKSVTTVKWDRKHRAQYGKGLVLDVQPVTKWATAEKLVAAGAATKTSEMEPGLARTAVGITAVGLALKGSIDTLKGFRVYREEIEAGKYIPKNKK